MDDVEVLKTLNKDQITKILGTNETLIKGNIKLLTQKRMAEIIVQIYGYQGFTLFFLNMFLKQIYLSSPLSHHFSNFILNLISSSYINA